MDPYDSGKATEGMVGRSLQLRRIDAVSAGRVMAVLYGVLGAIFLGLYAVGITLFAITAGGESAGMMIAGAIGMAVIGPVIYGALAFVMGLIMAAVYNLVSGWVGGLEFQFE